MPFSGFLKPKPSGGRKPMIGKQIITPGSANTPINFGFHDGTGYSAGVVVPVAKVLATETIAGQAGTMPNNPAENLGILGKTLLNLITNGNFASGTTGWISSGVTGFTATSNIASFTATAQTGYIEGNVVNLVNGHIYYVYGRIKSLSNQVYLCVAGTAYPVFHSGSGNFENLSVRATWGYASGNNNIGQIVDSRTSGWTQIQATNISMIDLTTVFGAGLEPTQAQMDAIITALGGWFDGNTILNKIASGGYLNNGVLGTPEVLLNDPNHIAANILSGKSIFGVAGSVAVGKRSATGNGNTDGSGILTVSGLLFQPSIIIVELLSGSTYILRTYTTVLTWSGTVLNSVLFQWNGTSGSGNTSSGGFTITANGFSVNMSIVSTATSWIAIE